MKVEVCKGKTAYRLTATDRRPVAGLVNLTLQNGEKVSRLHTAETLIKVSVVEGEVSSYVRKDACSAEQAARLQKALEGQPDPVALFVGLVQAVVNGVDELVDLYDLIADGELPPVSVGDLEQAIRQVLKKYGG